MAGHVARRRSGRSTSGTHTNSCGGDKTAERPSSVAGPIASLPAGRTERAEVAEFEREFSHDAILHGIDARLVKQAVDCGLLRQEEVHRLIPPSTLARKVRESRKLTRDEADQVARLLRIKAYARDVFEDAETAETWLAEPNPALGGRLPGQLLVTDEGTRAVETVLRRIDYGDYS
jgi:putative toxin-antitoxin system antitoxin component (TIGR02293 family)